MAERGIISIEAAIALIVAFVNLALDQADIHIMAISWVSVAACIVLALDILRRTGWASNRVHTRKRMTIGSSIILFVFIGFGAFLSLHKKAVPQGRTDSAGLARPMQNAPVSKPQPTNAPQPLPTPSSKSKQSRTTHRRIIPEADNATTAASAAQLPSVVINAPNGIANAPGGTLNNPTVNNTTGLAEPQIQLTPTTTNEPVGDLYRTEVRLTIISDVPIPSLWLRLDGPIVRMQAIPQRNGPSMEGYSGIRDGYAFTTLMNAYGEYVLTVFSKTPLEQFRLIYEPQGLSGLKK
jgi:hypothetical protein